MLKSVDFKLTTSSIEFSLFCLQPRARYCPSCGIYLPGAFGEFRISPFILILGVGSIFCYRMYLQKKRKQKKSNPCIAFTYTEQEILTYDDSCNSVPRNSLYFDDHRASLSYNVDYEPSESEMEQCFDQCLERFTPKQSIFSSQSTLIGTDTVAKLDQLLQQIVEIKESVGELNADLLETKKFDSSHYGKRLSGSTFSDDEITILSRDDLQPSLEWDSNDIKLYCESEDFSIPDLNLKAIQSSSEEESGQLVAFKSAYSTSEISSTSDSSCSSQVHFTERDVGRIKLIQELIDEARRQGLLPDLMRFLLKNSQRDSAYFED